MEREALGGLPEDALGEGITGWARIHPDAEIKAVECQRQQFAKAGAM